MKQRILLRLIVSLVLIATFVLGATVLEVNNSLEPMVWLAAQQHTPLLWEVDAFALLTLLPVFGFASAQKRLSRRPDEISSGREAHQNQLEQMIRNTDQMDRLNAEQADHITSLEQTVAALQTQLATQEAEALTRRQALETELRQLSEQAFLATRGQVEANTRQMEAVNLAMQYQRADIKQLRQGVRSLQRTQNFMGTAHLTPLELAALEGDTTPHLLENTISAEQSEELGFLVSTVNAQSTFISPLTAFAVAADFLNIPEPGNRSDPSGSEADRADMQTGLCAQEANGPDANVETRPDAAEPNVSEPIKSSETKTPAPGLTTTEYQWLLGSPEGKELDMSAQRGTEPSTQSQSPSAASRGWRLRM